MHGTSDMPPAPYHIKLYQCIRREMVVVVYIGIAVLHAALHLRKGRQGDRENLRGLVLLLIRASAPCS